MKYLHLDIVLLVWINWNKKGSQPQSSEHPNTSTLKNETVSCSCLVIHAFKSELIDLFPTFQIALATENSIILQNLDFAASGSYSCEVSLDTPIYTKASTEKQLTVFRKFIFCNPVFNKDRRF